MSKGRNIAVLVTGSRDWTDREAIQRALRAINLELRAADNCVIIHGDCRGADKIAGHYAKQIDWSCVPMPAQWNRNGTAGRDRNMAMLDVLRMLRFCGYKCRVLAFPLSQSKGTRHMMSIAANNGFKVENLGP